MRLPELCVRLPASEVGLQPCHRMSAEVCATRHGTPHAHITCRHAPGTEQFFERFGPSVWGQRTVTRSASPRKNLDERLDSIEREPPFHDVRPELDTDSHDRYTLREHLGD